MPSAPRGSAVRRHPPAAVPPKPPAVVKHAPPVNWTLDQWQEAMQAPLNVLGLELNDVQQRLLAQYMVMLAHWNSTYNLTALRDAPDMLSHHLADCLTVLAPLTRHLAQAKAMASTQTKLLDVGSGGGLPGVVLAICCPDVQVTCVDTVGKKAAFIRQVAAELRLGNLRAEHARVEQLKSQFDVVTSRAFASLVDFVSLTRALLAPSAVWMAMKGKLPEEEQAALPVDVSVFHVEQLLVPGLNAERCLIWMRPEQG